MGDQDVRNPGDEEQMRTFVRALLADVQALERMLEADVFESERTIGAEQEIFLIDRSGMAAPKAREVLAELGGDPRFVHELALFNLEANLTPLAFGGSCLTSLETELKEVMQVVRAGANRAGVDTFLCGILPTLRPSDLDLSRMTPNPRYEALNEVITRMHNGKFHFRIKGLDELELSHDNVMLEAANTSFQVHFQVGPREFASLYNASQAIAGPVLAAAVNSPMLLGKRLWKESRVAVFQQSIDARSVGQQVRGHRPRVDFGDSWVEHSVLEIFREDIARFRVLLAHAVEENAMQTLAEGRVPGLKALRLHNGTVYRWNRPCYGISPNGRPHLRIEARALPAGPTIKDEVANAALHFGLMAGITRAHDDIRTVLTHDEAKANFLACARFGLKAQVNWGGGRQWPVAQLLLEELIPLARAGLHSAGVDAADIDSYLGVVEERVESGRTGAMWALDSFNAMGRQGTRDQRMRSLVMGAVSRQATNKPVHEWDLCRADEASEWGDSYRYVGQFMTTDVFTVRPWDLVDMAACLMTWEKIRHVPVEDDAGHVVGLVSHRAVLRMVAQGLGGAQESVAVASIMRANPVTCHPSTPTLEAIALMRAHKVGCLPVVNERDGTLVGIITERDLIEVAGALLEKHLKDMETRDRPPAPAAGAPSPAPEVMPEAAETKAASEEAPGGGAELGAGA